MSKPDRNLKLYRRHRNTCKHFAQGRDQARCKCLWWCDGYVFGMRVNRSTGTANRRTAERYVRRLEIRVVISFSGAIRRYVEHFAARGVNRNTLAEHSELLKEFASAAAREKSLN